MSFGYELELPANATYRYVTMLREPVSWMLSLYFFLSKSRSVDGLFEFLEGQIATCPCLLRTNNETGCSRASQFRYWLAPTAQRFCDRPPSCHAIVDAWRSVDTLVTERYVESIDVMRRWLGLEPKAAATTHLNALSHTYSAYSCTVGTIKRLVDMAQRTCVSAVNEAALDRLEQGLER